MLKKPDYTTLRDEADFRWCVGATVTALMELTGIPIKEFNLNPAAGIELFRRGRPLIRDMFGQDVELPQLTIPPISYGHINGLGAELLFPDEGEVNHTKICDTLEKGIELLKKDVDFATAGMAPFYLEYRRKMSEAFDGENCYFYYGYEGPITTAYTLRGDKVFYDPYDTPELFKKFMQLLVKSIIEFVHFHAKVSGNPSVNPDIGGMADDISSMFSPEMWPDFVIPYWDRYYRGITTGRRKAHVEDLRPDHLPFLEEIGLIEYDPSVSHKINPKIISQKCRVPFWWRLVSFHYPPLTCSDVSDFVFKAVADGASFVITLVAATMCNDETVKKVHAFIEAAKEVERMLNQGATRQHIGRCVSKAGTKKFWDHWPE